MVFLNGEKQKLTLKCIFYNEVKNDLIVKENFRDTLISDKKTLYIYIDKHQKHDYFELYRKLLAFFEKNRYNLNIDVESFSNSELSLGDTFHLLASLAKYSEYDDTRLNSKEYQELNYNLATKYPNAEADFKRLSLVNHSVNKVRFLQDLPPNVLNSELLAQKVINDLKAHKNLKITLLGRQALEKLGTGLLLSVNDGSDYEAQLLAIEYIGDPKSNKKTALVGKGITFDTGGYSLKSGQPMRLMKFDMSGAAVVSGIMNNIATLQPKTNVIGILCITDNKIGPKATTPDSIVKSYNGLTVEINNTDAEGRLVMADGITYGIRKAHATEIITVSTLTGAIITALGTEITGSFSTCDKLFNQFQKSSLLSHEKVWRLPFNVTFKEDLEHSKMADITNHNFKNHGGSAVAASFLNFFTENLPYLHIDIAGTASRNERGTGIMVKTLTEFFCK